jgi:signal peptidase I
MSAKQHTLWFHLFDVILNIVIIVAIVATIRTFLISPFQVEGKSMMSTLEHEEYIVINKLAYHIGTPNRGDVVVFRPQSNPKKPYVKRVIGMPGDEVIIGGGFVSVRPSGLEDEIDLDERYLNDKNAGKTYQAPPSTGNTDEVRYRVPEGKYFLLGDNRQASLDSRSFRDGGGDSIPFVDKDSILGRVWVVALPLSKMHILESPYYGF